MLVICELNVTVCIHYVDILNSLKILIFVINCVVLEPALGVACSATIPCADANAKTCDATIVACECADTHTDDNGATAAGTCMISEYIYTYKLTLVCTHTHPRTHTHRHTYYKRAD
jgi:hypothetical protein